MKESLDEGNKALIVEELTKLLGRAPVDWSAVALTHNAHNPVTAGIWRVRVGSDSLMLKVISPGGDAAASREWSPSGEPSHWNYWKREALAYEDGITEVYSRADISGPRLLASNRRLNGNVALWLDDASGDGSVPGTRWSMEDYRRLARALGLAQGRIAATGAIPDRPWLTRGFLRNYALSKRVDRSVLYSDEAWRRPLVRNNLPDGLRRELVRLQEERDCFFSLIEHVSRTLCHLDVWPNNLFARKDGTFVLVDWSFVGEGAIGEDVGNLVPDSVFDLSGPLGICRISTGKCSAGTYTVCGRQDGRATNAWCGSGCAHRPSSTSGSGPDAAESLGGQTAGVWRAGDRRRKPPLRGARARPGFSRVLGRGGEGAGQRVRLHTSRTLATWPFTTRLVDLLVDDTPKHVRGADSGHGFRRSQRGWETRMLELASLDAGVR